MATKAERFKADAQREAHVKNRPHGADKHGAGDGDRVPRSIDAGSEAGSKAGSKTGSKARSTNPTSHNEAPRIGKDGTYELEPSTTARPPRKSTRRSPAHLKTDSSLRIKNMNRTASPQARAGRRGGNPT
jgi:hypothetical protein